MGVRIPLAGSTRKTDTESDSWLPASRNAPPGSMPKPRGVLPPVGVLATNARRPEALSTANTEMLLWPRFEPYRNAPDGESAISAVLKPFSGLTPGGSDDSACISASDPLTGSRRNAVTVQFNSLMTYAKRPDAAIARWRGPAPGVSAAKAGAAGVSAGFAASKR